MIQAPVTRLAPQSKYLALVISTFLSALCYYYGNGLNGDFWYLLWIAPLPVIVTSLVTSGGASFTFSFIAYLIGRLSWFSYLVAVATVVPAIIFTILPSLIFALIICLNRYATHKINTWYIVFAFPALFTTFEYLLIRFSPDGTGGSVAYSQSGCLPVIQIASVTGILGITFFVTLIPSAIALAWYFKKQKIKFVYIVVCSAFIICATLLFGALRLDRTVTKEELIKVGAAVLDEKKHNNSNEPEPVKDNAATEFYTSQALQFAAKGMQVVLFPERALSIDSASINNLLSNLCAIAGKNNIYIITGYTNLAGTSKRNAALVINPQGGISVNYDKVHLVEGQETQFKPGDTIGLFSLYGIKAGVAICKDMDFQEYIKQYGNNETQIMFIPAWDFITDDWLHSRMAILRGVENGFSEVRAAREGRLTISDLYGRVTYEYSSSNQQQSTLTGEVSALRINTFYTRFGNWFGVVNLISVFGLLILLYKKKQE